jgi:hypothetical protein
MKVLVLSPYADALSECFHNSGDCFLVKTDQITLDFCVDNGIEFLVSYGYRHIIDPTVIQHFSLRAINLHISLLPYSRGAHPNFWSIAEGSPTGVTIHLIDKGLDTGNILFQREVEIEHDVHSFATSYELLCRDLERLFVVNWSYVRRSECGGWSQQGKSTYHRSSEIDKWLDCLPQMWDTPIRLFKQLAAYKSRVLDSTVK